MQQRVIPSEVIMRSAGQFVPLPTDTDLVTLELQPHSTTSAAQSVIRLQIALRQDAPCSVENFVSLCLHATQRRARPLSVPRAYAALAYEGQNASLLYPNTLIAFPDPAASLGADSSSFFGPFFRLERAALRPLDRAGLVCVASRPLVECLPGGVVVSDILAPLTLSPPPPRVVESIRRYITDTRMAHDALVGRIKAGRAADTAAAAAAAASADNTPAVTVSTTPPTAAPAASPAPAPAVTAPVVRSAVAAPSPTPAKPPPRATHTPLPTGLRRAEGYHVASSGFFITLAPLPDAVPHVVIGEVVRGLEELVARTATAAVTKNNVPQTPITIRACGLARARRLAASDAVVEREAATVAALLAAADALDAMRAAAEVAATAPSGGSGAGGATADEEEAMARALAVEDGDGTDGSADAAAVGGDGGMSSTKGDAAYALSDGRADAPLAAVAVKRPRDNEGMDRAVNGGSGSVLRAAAGAAGKDRRRPRRGLGGDD